MPGRPRRQLPGGFRQGAPTTVAHVNLPYELTTALEPWLDDNEVFQALGDGKNVYLSDLIRGGVLLLHALLRTRTKSRVLRFLNLPFPQQEQLAIAHLAFRYGLAEAPEPPGAGVLMEGAPGTVWSGAELVAIDHDIREGYQLSMQDAGFEPPPPGEAPLADAQPWSGHPLSRILGDIHDFLDDVVNDKVVNRSQPELARRAIAHRQSAQHLLEQLAPAPAPGEESAPAQT